MSFMSASEIFEPVVRELVASGTPDTGVFRTTRVLIEVLVERGWDNVGGSVAAFTHPSVLAAANDLGYYVYDQIPVDGSMSTAAIRCGGCERRVRYYYDDEGNVRSEVHVMLAGGTTVGGTDLCPYSGKSPNGY